MQSFQFWLCYKLKVLLVGIGFKKAGGWCIKVLEWSSRKSCSNGTSIFQWLSKNSDERCWSHCWSRSSSHHQWTNCCFTCLWLWQENQWDHSRFRPRRWNVWRLRYTKTMCPTSRVFCILLDWLLEYLTSIILC